MIPLTIPDLAQLVQTVWSTMLGWELEWVDAELPPPKDALLVSRVNITGFWHGTIIVRCPRELMREMADALYCLSEAEPAEEFQRDALGEMTNIVAGNLKAIFPGRCFLSLPVVTEEEERDQQVSTGPGLSVQFWFRGLVLRVEICECPVSSAIHSDSFLQQT